MRSNSIQFRNYVKSCINTEYCNSFEEVYNTFLSEYWYEQNKKYFKYNKYRAFASWLSGLPSVINVDFMPYEILKIAEQHGMKLNTEKKQEGFIESWYNRVTGAFFYELERERK